MFWRTLAFEARHPHHEEFIEVCPPEIDGSERSRHGGWAVFQRFFKNAAIELQPGENCG